MPDRARTTRGKIVRGGVSMPLGAPMVPRFPFGCRDVEGPTLTRRPDPAAVRSLQPEPLEPTGDAATIHVQRVNDTSWRGTSTAEPCPRAQAPAHRPPVQEMGTGLLWRGDSMFAPGRLRLDRLKEDV